MRARIRARSTGASRARSAYAGRGPRRVWRLQHGRVRVRRSLRSSAPATACSCSRCRSRFRAMASFSAAEVPIRDGARLERRALPGRCGDRFRAGARRDLASRRPTTIASARTSISVRMLFRRFLAELADVSVAARLLCDLRERARISAARRAACARREDAHEKLAGVAFSGELATGYRACLWSRLASRILLPLAEFDAADARRAL